MSAIATFSYSAEFSVTALQDNVYLHQSGRDVEGYGKVTANGLIVVTGAQHAVLIDTPWDATDIDDLFAWLAARQLTLQSVVVTHSHEDAAGHLALFHKRNIATWAYTHTNTLLAEQGETPALNTFKEHHELVVGAIEVFYPGPGHTLDNTVVWIGAHKMLFGGCFIREQTTQSLGYTAEGDVTSWPASVEAVRNRYPDVQRVIPGHGQPGDKALLTHTAALARSANADQN